MRLWFRPALLALPLLCAQEENPDAAVLARIGELRARAAKIRVDGISHDWKDVPTFADADPAPVAEGGLDIEGIAVAPLEDSVLVRIATAKFPSRAKRAFSLEIDFLGRSSRDAVVRFGAEGEPEVTVLPEDGKRALLPAVPVEIAAAEAVEVRVPLSPIAAALGEPGKAWLRGERRSFVRVLACSWLPGGLKEATADVGPAAASFRLTDPPPTLDPPLAPDAEPKRVLLMPLAGKWFLRQGADGLWSHRGLVAYDLSLVDHALRPTAATGSKRLEDYYAFGKPIFAPEPGTVVFDSLQGEDRAPLDANAGKDAGNTMVIRFADGFRLLLGHLRSGSLAVDREAAFRLGAILAEVGNSRASGAPPRPRARPARPGEFVGLPLGFRKVRVGLNPGPDDPFARDLPEWTLREGWFVERK